MQDEIAQNLLVGAIKRKRWKRLHINNESSVSKSNQLAATPHSWQNSACRLKNQSPRCNSEHGKLWYWYCRRIVGTIIQVSKHSELQTWILKWVLRSKNSIQLVKTDAPHLWNRTMPVSAPKNVKTVYFTALIVQQKAHASIMMECHFDGVDSMTPLFASAIVC